jgi:hypothetical protein
MRPRQIVELWVDRFNAGDVAGLAELYHDDAINHQVTQEPVSRKRSYSGHVRMGFQNRWCIPDAIHEAGEVVVLKWRDPLGLRGCGFFTVRNGRIAFQRGYWDKLSFLKLHGPPLE